MEPAIIPFQNPDGSSNALRYFSAETPGDGPVLLHFPALGVRAAKYDTFATALARSGFDTYISDLRGKGASSIQPSRTADFGYREMLEQDMRSAIATVRQAHPGRRLFLMGHSLGGQHACLYSSRFPGEADGIVLIGCCSVYYKGWEGLAGLRILASTQMVGLLSRIYGYFPGRKVGFGGTNAKTMMLDWSNQSRTGKYRLTGDSFDYESALASLKLPVLTINFEGDNYAPPKALELLTEKFSPEAKVEKVYLRKDDARNEGYNHFNWAKRPDGVVEVIDGFLR